MLNLNGQAKDYNYIIHNYEPKINKLKMKKIQDFMSKINLYFYSLSISSREIFATWLHLQAPPKNTEKINKN